MRPHRSGKSVSAGTGRRRCPGARSRSTRAHRGSLRGRGPSSPSRRRKARERRLVRPRPVQPAAPVFVESESKKSVHCGCPMRSRGDARQPLHTAGNPAGGAGPASDQDYAHFLPIPQSSTAGLPILFRCVATKPSRRGRRWPACRHGTIWWPPCWNSITTRPMANRCRATMRRRRPIRLSAPLIYPALACSCWHGRF